MTEQGRQAASEDPSAGEEPEPLGERHTLPAVEKPISLELEVRLPSLEPQVCPGCEHQNPVSARFCNACGLGLLGDEPADARPGADPLVGRVLAGRYRIDEVIGRGGMGVVYRVEHVRMGKLMAVKLLHGDLARDAEVVRRFSREAEAVSKLDHPNTVQVFDFGQSDGMTWLVMELLSGRDLGAILTSEATMDFARAARIVWQIAGSVQQAHERGIVHRDLKPENVRILSDRSEPDFVKVMDFGLAKLRETEEQKRASITREGFLVGTPYYMAPEHIRGDTVDARTDVYALGAMLYKMIAGVPPFWAPTPVAVLTKHLGDDAIAPSRRSPRRDLPPDADRIVLRALEKNPANRQQSMNELRDELSRFLATVGTAPQSDRMTVPKVELSTESGRKVQVATRNDVDRFERRLQAQSVIGWILVAALLAVAGGSGWWFWGGRAPVAPTRESEPNNVPGTAGEVWLGTPIEGQLGIREDTTVGDSDVYRVVGLGPDDHFVRIDGSGLPNLDFVVDVFIHGRPDPVMVIDSHGRGAPERVPLLPVDPSAVYLLRVREAIPLGQYPTENVSDHYILSITAARPGEDEEVEPNDAVARGEHLALGESRRGYVGWRGDTDVYCLEEGAPRVVASVTGLPPLDLMLELTDRVTGGETHVDAAGLGAGERVEITSGHAVCVTVRADPNQGGHADPDRTYEFRFASE